MDWLSLAQLWQSCYETCAFVNTGPMLVRALVKSALLPTLTQCWIGRANIATQKWHQANFKELLFFFCMKYSFIQKGHRSRRAPHLRAQPQRSVQTRAVLAHALREIPVAPVHSGHPPLQLSHMDMPLLHQTASKLNQQLHLLLGLLKGTLDCT